MSSLHKENSIGTYSITSHNCVVHKVALSHQDAICNGLHSRMIERALDGKVNPNVQIKECIALGNESINSAESSVLFAVMQMFGQGSVMSSLKNLGSNKGLVSLGTIESEGQLKLFKPGIAHNTAVTSFSFLKRNIPEHFKAEWSGGQGQVIHHKFVVCDFNDKSPVVFCN
jgi:hypothetical protein